MSFKQCTREEDEVILDWLYLRDIGWTADQIAARYGTSGSYVRAATNRVRRAA